MIKALVHYKLATTDEVRSKGFGQQGVLSGMMTPMGINASIVFKVLKDAFGKPNGDYGEKSSWQWDFRVGDYLLCVYDYKGWWSIGIIGKEYSRAEKDSWALIEVEAKKLMHAIQLEAKKVKLSSVDSKMGGIIDNPYSIFNNTTNSLLEEASRITKEIEAGLDKAKDPFYTDGLNRMITVSSLFRAAFITNYLALEGFINVVYEIFLRERYKTAAYRRKLRNEDIFYKLLETDKYCLHFEQQVISSESELYKALTYLSYVRNDFVHGNIGVGMKKHWVVKGSDPVLLGEKLETKYGIDNNPNNISRKDVILAQRIGQKIIVSVINSMDKVMRFRFAVVHAYTRISFAFGKDKIVIPLTEDDFVPEEEIESFLSLGPDLDKAYYDIS